MNKVKLLIIDDSAVIRHSLRQLLDNDPQIQVVGTAINAQIASKKIQLYKPDVLLLDINMPGIDGLTFLKQLMRYNPLPVVIFSSYAPSGSFNALKALSLGALEIINKPILKSESDLLDYKNRLRQAILSAASADLSKAIKLSKAVENKSQPSLKKTHLSNTPNKDIQIIAIGASTGGTEAIRYILSKLPPNMPPITIVQHMPVEFTKSFAQNLDSVSQLHVQQTDSRQQALSGNVYIAPGNKHLIVQRFNNRLFVQPDDSPPLNRFKPSIDKLFLSVAQAAGSKAIAILLTGMGDDGVKGMKRLFLQGAITIAQDRDTSVVYGMPKEAIQQGAAKHVMSLFKIPDFLATFAKKKD